MEELYQCVERLIERAAERAMDEDEALKYSQAATNAANAIHTLQVVMRMNNQE